MKDRFSKYNPEEGELVFLSEKWLEEFKNKPLYRQEAEIYMIAKCIADCIIKAKEVPSAKLPVEQSNSKNVP